MDDIAQKLNDLLNSEDGLNQIKQMAEMFGMGSNSDGAPDLSAFSEMFGKGKEENQYSSSKAENDKSTRQTHSGTGFGDLGGLGDLFKNIDIQMLLKIMNAYSKGGDDDNSKLLLALKPMLSDKRQGKVDEAINIMKLIALLPLIKESGLLGNLFGE